MILIQVLLSAALLGFSIFKIVETGGGAVWWVIAAVWLANLLLHASSLVRKR